MFATAVVLVDALVGESGLSRTLRARREQDVATARLRALQVENAGLAERAQRLTHDPGTIESLARKNLGLIRPGEVVFVLTPVK